MRIAITGGIGSGKSTVCKIIEENGFAVYSCDKIYKTLLTEPDFISRLEAEFGHSVVKEGKLDAKKLSAIVFTEPSRLEALNKLTHPEIMKRALALMDNNLISFCEVPLLFEGGYENLFDAVIVVARDKKERMKAVSERDGIEVEQVIKRINAQIDYDNMQFAKYYVIHNDGNLDDLREKTLKIIQKFR